MDTTRNIADEHWWGNPAMPEGMEYPYTIGDNPMTLICQFHLGEGMVYVFADLDYFFGDYDVHCGGMGEWPDYFYKVLYSPTRKNLHEHEVLYEDGTSAAPEPQAMDEPAKRGEESDVLCRPTNFGYEISRAYPDYEVLLQLDECEPLGLRFYDCGTLYFLITPEDLEARRFDNVKCVMYSF